MSELPLSAGSFLADCIAGRQLAPTVIRVTLGEEWGQGGLC